MKVLFFDTFFFQKGYWRQMRMLFCRPACIIHTVFNQGGAWMPRSCMSHSFNPVQRDTRAWQYQVWISFGIAISMCAIGLAWLPGQHLEQAFMVMGYMFCLSAAFVLAKFVRDKQADSGKADAGDTPMWRFVVWGGFAVAMGLTGWGLLGMDINPTYKAFLGVSWLYMITTAFTLAKMLRDKHEADLNQAIYQARREPRSADVSSQERV